MWFDGLLLPAETGFLMVAVSVAAALLMDRIFGEPRRFHPLVGFGHWASWVETLCRNLTPSPSLQQLRKKWTSKRGNSGMGLGGTAHRHSDLSVTAMVVSLFPVALVGDQCGRALFDHRWK